MFFLFTFLLKLTNTCSDFKIGGVTTGVDGYTLLSLAQLNQPDIRGLLKDQYDAQGGLYVGKTFTSSNACMQTSDGEEFTLPGYSSGARGCKIVGTSVTQQLGTYYIGDKVRIGQSTCTSTGISATEEILSGTSSFTQYTACSLANNAGIFGINCNYDVIQTIYESGTYSFLNTNKGVGKFSLQFTMDANYICVRPLLTVKTQMINYLSNNINKYLLVNYISGTSVGSRSTLDKCGGTTTDYFCKSNSMPMNNNNCNTVGYSTTDCNRNDACTLGKVITTSNWGGGVTRGITISNGVNVNTGGCGYLMNVEVILQCADDIQFHTTNGVTQGLLFTSTVTAPHFQQIFWQSSVCNHARIKLNTALLDYDQTGYNEYIQVIYNRGVNEILVSECGSNLSTKNNFCRYDANICDIQPTWSSTTLQCPLTSASCPYSYYLGTLASYSYHSFTIISGSDVHKLSACDYSMNIQFELTCGPTQTPTKIPTNNPTFTKNPTLYPTKLTKIPTNIPTIYPTQYPSVIPTKLPTLNPTKLPTNNPSNIPTLIPSIMPSIGTTIAVTQGKNDFFTLVANGDRNTIIIGIAIISGVCICCFLVIIMLAVKNRKAKQEVKVANAKVLSMSMRSLDMGNTSPSNANQYGNNVMQPPGGQTSDDKIRELENQVEYLKNMQMQLMKQGPSFMQSDKYKKQHNYMENDAYIAANAGLNELNTNSQAINGEGGNENGNQGYTDYNYNQYNGYYGNQQNNDNNQQALPQQPNYDDDNVNTQGYDVNEYDNEYDDNNEEYEEEIQNEIYGGMDTNHDGY